MKLPLLSGRQVLSALERMGFVELHRRGDYIALPPKAAYAIVFDPNDKHDPFDVLPLLTMTGLHQSGDGIEAESSEEIA